MEIKKRVGTEITLFLNEDSLEFANEYRAREVLEKYCSFMPVEIYPIQGKCRTRNMRLLMRRILRDDDVVVEHIHEEAKMEEKENENGEKEMVEVFLPKRR